MKKVLFVAFMVMAFMALASMAAFACGGDKAEKASAKTASACSADKATNAKLASSKTTGDKAACTAAEKAACASKASLAKADGKNCSIEMCLEACKVKHAELCGENAASHQLTAMSIKGMTCAGCENSVKTALMSVEGVTNVVDVCHKAGFAVVCTDNAKFKSESLVKMVSAKGYESEIIPAVAKTTQTTEKAECAAHKKESSN